ncbi:hypothetical protein Y032_0230g2951 [Ancylostoma ceylanicum]|uniref:Uncharacterized protein n=1 Tax=Ancylostoma ceylanicum TaxID=53326 RepID=A0A016SG52_9BILA|nr:hypothetical protein Y032_0230g2951 [Ancylostoma ceylanicum]
MDPSQQLPTRRPRCIGTTGARTCEDGVRDDGDGGRDLYVEQPLPPHQRNLHVITRFSCLPLWCLLAPTSGNEACTEQYATARNYLGFLRHFSDPSTWVCPCDNM